MRSGPITITTAMTGNMPSMILAVSFAFTSGTLAKMEKISSNTASATNMTSTPIPYVITRKLNSPGVFR